MGCSAGEGFDRRPARTISSVVGTASSAFVPCLPCVPADCRRRAPRMHSLRRLPPPAAPVSHPPSTPTTFLTLSSTPPRVEVPYICTCIRGAPCRAHSRNPTRHAARSPRRLARAPARGPPAGRLERPVAVEGGAVGAPLHRRPGDTAACLPMRRQRLRARRQGARREPGGARRRGAPRRFRIAPADVPGADRPCRRLPRRPARAAARAAPRRAGRALRRAACAERPRAAVHGQRVPRVWLHAVRARRVRCVRPAAADAHL